MYLTGTFPGPQDASALNCSEYSDDSVYTSTTCTKYDNISCGMYCSGWCDSLCGEACDSGGGAVCALEILSNLTALCQELGMCSTLGADAPSDSSISADAPTMAPTPGVGGEQCDDHALCNLNPFSKCNLPSVSKAWA